MGHLGNIVPVRFGNTNRTHNAACFLWVCKISFWETFWETFWVCKISWLFLPGNKLTLSIWFKVPFAYFYNLLVFNKTYYVCLFLILGALFFATWNDYKESPLRLVFVPWSCICDLCQNIWANLGINLMLYSTGVWA